MASALRLATLLAAVVLVYAADKAKKYDEHQVWAFIPKTHEQIESITDLEDKITLWWHDIMLGYQSEAVIPMKHMSAVLNACKVTGMDCDLHNSNYQFYLDKQLERVQGKSAYDHADFNTLDKFEAEMKRLVKICPKELTCQIESIGVTWQKKNMWKIKVSDPKAVSPRAVWIESLTHGRDWLSGATSMSLLRHIIEDYSTADDVKTLLSSYTFHFVPVVNPDGYEYTWTHDRLWAKNLRPDDKDMGCIGVNLNRNYDHSWGMHTSGTCSDDLYHGPSAASEPEIKNLQKAMKAVNDKEKVVLFVSMHTSVPSVLLPYGHLDGDGNCEMPENFTTHHLPAAQAYVEAVANINKQDQWIFGAICQVYSPASGDSLTYYTDKLKIPYAIAPQMRGPGFDPPKAGISLSFREHWAGLVATLDTISKGTEDKNTKADHTEL